jgi:WhiB family redox-sensing transcriptional regulator
MPFVDQTDDFADLEPGFVRPDDSWQADGVCRQVGFEPFFQGKGGKGYAEAKRICQQCPVIEQCLAYAVSTRQEFGCWGGTSPNERDVLRHHAA